MKRNLMNELVEELYVKLDAWEKCADRLFVYAEEIKCTVHNMAVYEAVCSDIADYRRLKDETKSNE